MTQIDRAAILRSLPADADGDDYLLRMGRILAANPDLYQGGFLIPAELNSLSEDELYALGMALTSLADTCRRVRDGHNLVRTKVNLERVEYNRANRR